MKRRVNGCRAAAEGALRGLLAGVCGIALCLSLLPVVPAALAAGLSSDEQPSVASSSSRAPSPAGEESTEDEIEERSSEGSVSSEAEEASAENENEEADMSALKRYPLLAFEVLLYRPLAFSQMVVGGALFVPIAPFALLGGRDNALDVFDAFAGAPYRMTFEDPLGGF